MKKIINTIKNKSTEIGVKTKSNLVNVMTNNRGDANVGTALQILICVVIGALLLSGLYTLFSDIVLPTVTQRVQDMFNYQG